MSYPSPIDCQIFTKYWRIYSEDVNSRDNAKASHYEILRIFCQMHVECDRLQHIIDEEGYSMVSEGRHGTQRKPLPEISLLQKTRSEIRAYASLLGIKLAKDTVSKDEDKEEDLWK